MREIKRSLSERQREGENGRESERKGEKGSERQREGEKGRDREIIKGYLCCVCIAYLCVNI